MTENIDCLVWFHQCNLTSFGTPSSQALELLADDLGKLLTQGRVNDYVALFNATKNFVR